MGTSAGALTGSLYSAGYSPEQVRREVSHRDVCSWAICFSCSYVQRSCSTEIMFTVHLNNHLG
jgi:hypothetical protein